MSGIPSSEIPQIPFLWTHGVAGRETLHYLDRNGFDGEPLLSRAELSRGRLLEDPGGISFTAQSRFLELAAIEANDTLLGLHVAAEMDLRDAGILFTSRLRRPRLKTRLTTWSDMRVQPAKRSAWISRDKMAKPS